MALRLLLARIPLWVWVAIALLAAGLFYGHDRFNAGQAEVQARWDAQEAAYASQHAEAITAARVLEERHRAELKAVADRFLTEQRKADEDHAADLAALRSGALRVRDRLRCPPAAGMPEAAADSGSPVEAGGRGLQPEDARLVLRIGADADRVARQLNALIKACKVR